MPRSRLGGTEPRVAHGRCVRPSLSPAEQSVKNHSGRLAAVVSALIFQSPVERPLHPESWGPSKGQPRVPSDPAVPAVRFEAIAVVDRSIFLFIAGLNDGPSRMAVVIDGLDLDKEVLGRVNSAIQKAAVAALADLDLQGDFRFHFPRYPRPEWWGLWLDRVDRVDRRGPQPASSPRRSDQSRTPCRQPERRSRQLIWRGMAEMSTDFHTQALSTSCAAISRECATGSTREPLGSSKETSHRLLNPQTPMLRRNSPCLTASRPSCFRITKKPSAVHSAVVPAGQISSISRKSESRETILPS